MGSKNRTASRSLPAWSVIIEASVLMYSTAPVRSGLSSFRARRGRGLLLGTKVCQGITEQLQKISFSPQGCKWSGSFNIYSAKYCENIQGLLSFQQDNLTSLCMTKNSTASQTQRVFSTGPPAVPICLLLKTYEAPWRGESDDNNSHRLLSSWNLIFGKNLHTFLWKTATIRTLRSQKFNKSSKSKANATQWLTVSPL